MNYDIIIGLLIGLAATCMGGMFVMLTMYWMGERDQGHGPGRGDVDPPGPPPPVRPDLEIPDYVPDEWLREAA